MAGLRAVVPFALLTLWTCPLALRAQTPKAAPPPPTLAQVLAALPPPSHGVLLAVGAERAALPAPSDAAGTAPDPHSLAAFGYAQMPCGSVSAVAPSTMAVLNGSPAAPDIAADLRPTYAFQMLAASLDNAQWRLLTSDKGIGLSGLTNETQAGLFRALFPQGSLLLASEDPALSDVPDGKRPDVQDVSDQISSARLRLGQTSRIYIHDTSGSTLFFGGARPAAPGRLRIYQHKLTPIPGEHGVLLRALVPNAPKPGDLRFDTSALQTPISLAGLRTVGDLVSRIGNSTRLELYADPHYAGRSLTIAGSLPTAPACDLLRALALCVTGTYRRVGPAFVLTDDLIGVGARRQGLAEWGKIADAAITKLTDRAGLALLEHRASGARTLPSYGDPLAMTPSQIKAEHNSFIMPELPEDYQSYYAFDKLTPAQQQWARQIAADYETARSAGTLPDYMSIGGHTPGPADLTGKVDLTPQNKVQLLLPSVPAPVDTDFVFGTTFMLYWPGMAGLQHRQHEASAKQTAPSEAPHRVGPPPLPLSQVFPAWPRRAVLAHPHNAADVDALVNAAQAIGLNALWLDVFSGGQARVLGSALAPAALPPGADIVSEALARTKGTGIAVYADMSLLPWGDNPPPAACDLDILGRTNRAAAQSAQAWADAPALDAHGDPLPVALPPALVSPASRLVQTNLTVLVRALAAQRGLAGFVWEDAQADADMGYTPALRLSFLRAAHADPLDITPDNTIRLDVSLPAFDDKAVDSALAQQWRAARLQANVSLLLAMRGAANLPVFMAQEADHVQWLSSWDDPKQLPPALRSLFPHDPYPSSKQVNALARAQGHTVLLRQSVEYGAGPLADVLGHERKEAPWDGFVLDFPDPADTRGLAPLSVLVPPPPAAPPPAPAVKAEGIK